MSEEIVIGEEEMELIVNRLVSEILERNSGKEDLLVVGIERRGADLARRLASRLAHFNGAQQDIGTLDMNFYRDDWTVPRQSSPRIMGSRMPWPVDGKRVLLVDDVLYSGRTVRAALEALLDYGRPARVELLVFVDRGHRELPIAPDYVGRPISTSKNAHVDVLFRERDGLDAVRVIRQPDMGADAL